MDPEPAHQHLIDGSDHDRPGQIAPGLFHRPAAILKIGVAVVGPSDLEGLDQGAVVVVETAISRHGQAHRHRILAQQAAQVRRQPLVKLGRGGSGRQREVQSIDCARTQQAEEMDQRRLGFARAGFGLQHEDAPVAIGGRGQIEHRLLRRTNRGVLGEQRTELPVQAPRGVDAAFGHQMTPVQHRHSLGFGEGHVFGASGPVERKPVDVRAQPIRQHNQAGKGVEKPRSIRHRLLIGLERLRKPGTDRGTQGLRLGERVIVSLWIPEMRVNALPGLRRRAAMMAKHHPQHQNQRVFAAAAPRQEVRPADGLPQTFHDRTHRRRRAAVDDGPQERGQRPHMPGLRSR